MGYIKIDNDNWDEVGVIYGVLEYSRSSESTGVKLVLQNCETEEITHRTVAEHQIEWLKDI